ncbi:MAG: O-antigen ligase family protein [Desmonostoc geniculatum HA4340-LM1]|jgi:O-antigen ligase|nr:O-antigen ligase family protein [Desmonostoc geniculatum HA4340-LM1]
MRKLLIYSEYGFTVASLLVYAGAVITLVLSGGALQQDHVEYDNSLTRIAYLIIYAITLLLLVLRWKKTISILIKGFLFYPIFILAAISIIWSADASATLKSSFSLISSSLFGMYFASRYSLKQQLQLVAWTFGIIIILSIIFAIVLPQYGIQADPGSSKWRGVFTHKNGLGARMVTSSIVFFILGYQNRGHRQRWLLWLGFSFSILLLLLSSSTSSLIILLIMIVLFFAFQVSRWSYQLMVPTLIIMTTISQILYFWLSNSADALLTGIGKDPTLTGRTDLWPLVMDMIWKRPWLGYGFGAFWQGWDGESAYIWLNSGWLPSHAHSGYLTICLDLGFLGLGLFFLGFWRSYLQGVRWVRISKTASDIWPVIHMTYIVSASFTESALLESNSFNWILYVAACLSLKMVHSAKF